MFIIGDLVEGVGVYPGQENDLEIGEIDFTDINEQYKLLAEYIRNIPKHIEIFICPGNHDYVRIPEPQPSLSKSQQHLTIISEIGNIENVNFVHNPCNINVGKTDSFEGHDVLLYHGYSFTHYANSVDFIRQLGGLDETCEIMKYLLQKRHLAPSHGSTQYQLGYKEDPLVIEEIPDFFVSGHVHKTDVKHFKGVNLLQCSCWIKQTDYQEKRGLEPDPCKAIYVDLKTMEIEVVSFKEEAET